MGETVFGPANAFAGSKNDLHAQAVRLANSRQPKPEIYMWCGEQDTLLPINNSTAFHLKKLGFPVNYVTSEGGHSWKCWDAQIEKVLDWLPFERTGG